jgi:integrase
MNPATRHVKLLENVNVRRWYENNEAKSKITAQTYLRNFGLWLEYLNLKPEGLIDRAKNDFDNLKGEIADQVRRLERKGTHGASISTSLKAVISFLRFFNISVKFNINIKNENRNLKAEQERIPDKEELAKILRIATVRERVSISLMAFSGLRPEVLGNIDGTDGLVLGDIIDLEIGKNEVSFSKIPVQIRVRPELSKIRQSYFTFLGNEGAEYLKEYLNLRLKDGERVKADSPVILPVEKQSLDKKNRFLMTTLLLRRIKATIDKAGYDWRPYIFRIYFGTNLDSAEAKGLISHPWRQFIMGHKGDIEETYTKREGKIDEGRDQYAKCLPYIETQVKGMTPEQSESLEKRVKIMFLTMSGFTPGEAEELVTLSDEDLQKKMKEKLGMKILNGNSQKVISMAEVEKYITEGFEFVSPLPDNKCIIRLPK